ncbi:MAG TPA: arginase [Burkholderiales bacterium]
MSDPSTHPLPAAVIGVASGLGARDPRCRDGPAALERDGLLARLAGRGVQLSWRSTLEPEHHPGQSRMRAISEICNRLAREVGATIRAGGLPVVVGGDHSCAIGTWSGAARAVSPRGPLGLVWIDAHMDSHTPATSHSGMPHGMPLAALLGHGASRELAIEVAEILHEGQIAPRHVCLVGVRSHEPEEEALLTRLGVRIVHMDELRARGLDAVMREAIDIARADTAGYGITLDLDAMDPLDVPGVGTPVRGGIAAPALIEALATCCAKDAALVALEVVEYNPHRDVDRRTAQVVEDVIAAVLGPRPAAEASFSPA